MGGRETEAAGGEAGAKARYPGKFPQPSQETGEVRSPCDALHRQANLQAPTRAGVEDKMKPTIRRFHFFVFFFLASVLSLRAQSDSSRAHLSGMLVDSSGAGGPGVHITAHPDNSPNTAPLTTSSANDGSYSLDLPPRRYHFHFTRESFVPRALILDLSPAQSRKLDLHLELERLAASVVVTAQAEPALEQETSASGTVITRDEIEKRQAVSLTDALIYTPGVSTARPG